MRIAPARENNLLTRLDSDHVERKGAFPFASFFFHFLCSFLVLALLFIHLVKMQPVRLTADFGDGLEDEIRIFGGHDIEFPDTFLAVDVFD